MAVKDRIGVVAGRRGFRRGCGMGGGAEVPPREGQGLLWGGWVVIVAACGDRLVMCKKGREGESGIKGRGKAG